MAKRPDTNKISKYRKYRRSAEFMRYNRIKRRPIRDFLVDYGALIGSVSTIFAGYLAWIGVQDQIKYQFVANQYSEATILRSELNRAIVRYKTIKSMMVVWQTVSLMNDFLFSQPRSHPLKISQLLRDKSVSDLGFINPIVSTDINPIVEDFPSSIGENTVNLIKRVKEAVENKGDQSFTEKWKDEALAESLIIANSSHTMCVVIWLDLKQKIDIIEKRLDRSNL